jgi:hypothetical protein
MNREKAFFILGWNELLEGDAYSDWRDEFLFSAAQDLVAKMYALPLVMKRVEEIQLKWEALSFLKLEAELSHPTLTTFLGQGKLDFLRFVEQQTSELKHRLTSAQDVASLLRSGQETVLFLRWYGQSFELFFDSSFPASEENVLSKDVLNTAALIRFLKQGIWPDEATQAVRREKKRLHLFLPKG